MREGVMAADATSVAVGGARHYSPGAMRSPTPSPSAAGAHVDREGPIRDGSVLSGTEAAAGGFDVTEMLVGPVADQVDRRSQGLARLSEGVLDPWRHGGVHL